ncbi:hypothetical protein JCM5350_004330 [Sporobolomyces pararoseus]
MIDVQLQLEWLLYMRERPILVINGFPLDLPLDHSFLQAMGRKHGAICTMRPGSCNSELSMVFARKTDALYAWSKSFEVPFDESKPEATIRCYLGRFVKYLPNDEQFDKNLDPSLRYFLQPQANMYDTRFLPRGYLEGDPEHKQRWSHENPLNRPSLTGGPPRQVIPRGNPNPNPASTSIGIVASASNIASTSSSVVSSGRAPLPPQSELAPQFSALGAEFAASLKLSTGSGRPPLPPQRALAPQAQKRSSGADAGVDRDKPQPSTHLTGSLLPRSASSAYDNFEASIVTPEHRQIIASVPIIRDEAAIYADHVGDGDRRQSLFKLREEFYWKDDNFVRDRVCSYWREALESISQIEVFQHHSQDGHWTIRVLFNDPGAKSLVPDDVLIKRAGGQRDSTYRRKPQK